MSEGRTTTSMENRWYTSSTPVQRIGYDGVYSAFHRIKSSYVCMHVRRLRFPCDSSWTPSFNNLREGHRINHPEGRRWGIPGSPFLSPSLRAPCGPRSQHTLVSRNPKGIPSLSATAARACALREQRRRTWSPLPTRSRCSAPRRARPSDRALRPSRMCLYPRYEKKRTAKRSEPFAVQEGEAVVPVGRHRNAISHIA